MEFLPESKAESLIRNLFIAILMIAMLIGYAQLSAWLGRTTATPPMIEKAWLDESSGRVYIDYLGRRNGGDIVNTNGIFICSVNLKSPEALRCTGDGDRVEPTHVHKDPFVWHVIWSETRPGHFSGLNPDAELVVPTIGMLKSSPLPDEVLDAIRNEDTYLVLAVGEKLFSSRYISKSRP